MRNEIEFKVSGDIDALIEVFSIAAMYLQTNDFDAETDQDEMLRITQDSIKELLDIKKDVDTVFTINCTPKEIAEVLYFAMGNWANLPMTEHVKNACKRIHSQVEEQVDYDVMELLKGYKISS